MLAGYINDTPSHTLSFPGHRIQTTVLYHTPLPGRYRSPRTHERLQVSHRRHAEEPKWDE